MILARIVKSGNSFVIRVPREEMERVGVEVDEYVTVDIHRADIRPKLTTDLSPLVEARLAQPETAAAFELLADA
jgi:antitoxin component of MazEF toxin-antitoxin module